jgi:ribosome maturation factor RimP
VSSQLEYKGEIKYVGSESSGYIHELSGMGVESKFWEEKNWKRKIGSKVKCPEIDRSFKSTRVMRNQKRNKE